MTPKALVDTEKVKILKLLQQTMAKLNTDQEKLDLLSEIEDVIDSYTFVPVDDISPPIPWLQKGVLRMCMASGSIQALKKKARSLVLQLLSKMICLPIPQSQMISSRCLMIARNVKIQRKDSLIALREGKGIDNLI